LSLVFWVLVGNDKLRFELKMGMATDCIDDTDYDLF
jgi:hypothetical protein